MKKILALCLLISATIIAFYPSLSNEFTNWDDNIYVLENMHIQKLNLQNLQYIFTHPISNNYNPLTILTFALEVHTIGYDSYYYHLHNLILHLFNTVFVFFLGRVLGLQLLGALLLSLLFGVHPMRVESVVWIAERKDVLFGFFYLLAMITYIFYVKKADYKYFILTIFLFILALLSKIQAVSLPLTLLLLDYYLLGQLSKKHFLEKIPLFVLSLGTAFLGIYFLKDSIDINQSFYFYERILLACYSLLVYVFKLVFPIHLSAYYPYPTSSTYLPIYYYFAPILIGMISFLLYKVAKKSIVIHFGTLFFLANVIFVSQIVGAGEAFLADRFTYLPYFGLFFMVAYYFEKFIQKKTKYSFLFLSVIVLYILFLGLKTRQQSKVWQNSETLWSNVIKLYPNQVPVAYNNRANFYRSQQDFDRSLADLNQAIELNPNYALAYNNRGNTYFKLKKYDKALADYEKALTLNKNNKKAYNNIAALYFTTGQLDKAIFYATKTLTLDPNYKDAYYNRGVAYSVKGQFDLAKKDYDRFLNYIDRPQKKGDQANFVRVYHWRGVANRELGDLEAALRDFNASIGLNADLLPNNYVERSFVYKIIGRYKAALKDLNKAIELGLNVDTLYIADLKKNIEKQ